MNQAQTVAIVAAELRLFLRPGRRSGPVAVALDGTSSLGHVVESLGVPLTEAGRLLVNGEPAAPAYRPRDGDVVGVEAAPPPARTPNATACPPSRSPWKATPATTTPTPRPSPST